MPTAAQTTIEVEVHGRGVPGQVAIVCTVAASSRSGLTFLPYSGPHGVAAT